MNGYETDDRTINLARRLTYRFLAAGLRHPSECFRELRQSAAMEAMEAATAILRQGNEKEPIPLGFGELPPAALDPAEILQWLRQPADDLFAEYDRVFGVGPVVDCPPYETEFFNNQEPFFRAQQMADVAGFYQAFGLNISKSRPERPDHIALELEFMSWLVFKERMALERNDPQGVADAYVCRDAQEDFLTDHMVWWMPSYATGLRKKAGDGPYACLGRMLSAFLPIERAQFNIKAPQAPVRPRMETRPEDHEMGCEGCSVGS
jgi:DMSO reductase family type II enzyme chaperone